MKYRYRKSPIVSNTEHTVKPASYNFLNPYMTAATAAPIAMNGAAATNRGDINAHAAAAAAPRPPAESHAAAVCANIAILYAKNAAAVPANTGNKLSTRNPPT